MTLYVLLSKFSSCIIYTNRRLAIYHNFPGTCQIFLAYFEVRQHKPYFGESEALVRHEVEARLVDLARLLVVTCLQLLVQRVVDPQVDVASPVTFLLCDVTDTLS